MSEMDRRQFMLALGGLGLLGTADALAPFTDPLPGTAGEAVAATAVHTRRNVYCLNAYSADIVAYKRAITAMKALPATNKTSWLAQANIHGAFSPPAGMIANACQHGGQFFLSWHRMYLHFFERIVRKHSGNPNFSLPYWGYSPTGDRTLPTVFRTPADATNSLYIAQRNAAINTGSSLSASTVDAGAALMQIAYGTFSSFLEGTPHGVVHTGVGGFGPATSHFMSYFETAAQDPIFWLHHCNIDRLWEIWLASGGGRVNPSSGSWLTQTFNFYDENGNTVPLKGGDIVDTAGQLNYKYDGLNCTPVLVIDPRLLRVITKIPLPIPPFADTIRRRRPLPRPLPLAAQQTPVRLDSARADVTLPVSAEGRRRLATFPREPAAGNQLTLVLEDIRLDRPPAVYYEIYVNLPADVMPDYTSPHYAGNLDFFGPAPNSARGRAPQRRSISLLPVYARLRAQQRWSDANVRVTFVPRAYIEGQRPAEVLRGAVQGRLGRVSVRIE